MALYVQFPGITGDSTDANYPGAQGWFNATTYTMAAAPASNSNANSPSFKETPVAITIGRTSSEGSPDLMLAWAEGRLAAQIVIAQTTGSGVAERPCARLTLAMAAITSYLIIGESTAAPTESLVVQFQMITYQQFWNNGANSETHSFNFQSNAGS